MSPWSGLVLLQLCGGVRNEIIKSVPENIQQSKDLSHQIPWGTERLTEPWTSSGVVEGQ